MASMDASESPWGPGEGRPPIRDVPPGISDPVDYIARTRETYDTLGYEPYRWVVSDDPPPFVEVDKPIGEWRVGMIGSGGIYQQGQLAYHFRDDASFRSIPVDAAADSLRATHFAYDLADARRDPNAVFPLERLRELASEQVIGGLTDVHASFVGGLYSVRKCRDELAPALVELMRDQQADVVLLVPV